MNRKHNTMIVCQGCGTDIGIGWKFKDRKFCSNRCQRDQLTLALQEEWLSTGKLKNHTGGLAGNSPKGKFVRDYILADQEHKCEMCGTGEIWNEKVLKFVLDHISGDSTDNSRENLRLICHNCDSQTGTYKNRNKGNGRTSRGFNPRH